MKKYSIIIPVYNRPVEVKELLESMVNQTYKNYEMIIVEDGSDERCEDVVNEYKDRIDLKYFYKENTGPGFSRNYGMERAEGAFLLFFDSDCLIPADYLTKVEAFMEKAPLDAYGGPDAAHSSFSDMQKAIDYSMTSFITTGGIRGKKKQVDNFQPRSFNMGISREVYEKVGGFREIHPGEDPDLSYRIMDAGFRVGLIPEAFVYHKRRIDLQKFKKQVYKFGVVRVILSKWYPDRHKIIYAFPTLFLLGVVALVGLGLLVSWYFFLPLFLFSTLIFIDALFKTKRIKIAGMAVITSFIQLMYYGYGFLKSWWQIKVLKKHERKAFKDMFFEQKR